jgi:hypothetical protein
LREIAKTYIYGDIASKRLLERLVAIHPEGRRMSRDARGDVRLSGWYAELPVGGKKWAQVKGILESEGLKAQTQSTLRLAPNEYQLRIERKYVRSDLEACSHLLFNGVSMIEGLFRDDEGRIKLTRSHLKRRSTDRVLCACAPAWIVVPSRTREVLESFSPAHVVFRPTVLVNRIGSDQRYYSWDSFGDPWWEVDSDLILPPMAASMDIVDNDGRPMRGDDSNGCFIRDGIVSPVEPHYARGALEYPGPFDLACTHERLGIHPADDSRLKVASKRFYLICREHGIKASWVPVRVDDG